VEGTTTNHLTSKHGIRSFHVQYLRCWNRGAWTHFFHSKIDTLDSDAFLLP
jgi:hypothetical protein